MFARATGGAPAAADAGAAPATGNLLRSLAPMIVLAIVVTGLVLAVMWRQQSNYRPVFGQGETVAGADMMAALDAAKVPYRIHPETGQVLVPAGDVGKTRMLLASKGVVAKLPAGLELMDTKDPLGVSQFVQDVRFRRGLEGELAQSISSLDAVQTARVHLSMAKSSSFVLPSSEKSSASVVVTLKPGRQLEQEQIAAIINLVANSAPGLEPTRVSLVDQGGHLLSARVDLTDGFELGHGNDAAAWYQAEMRKNVQDLLSPVLGASNFKVSVTAEVDNDRIRETLEQYGDTPKVTNEALREARDTERLALGVPGSLSNRPIDTPAANADGANPVPDSTTQNTASTRQYAYDRSVTQIQRSRGRLKKLNVAVVLNSLAAPGGAAAWTPEQLADVERVLAGGLGIDASRGDTLVVSTLAFPQPLPVDPWWKQPDNVVQYGSWLLYAVAALLAFLLIVRPLLKVVQGRYAALPPVAVERLAPPPPPVEPPAIPAPVEKRSLSVGALLEDYDLPPPGSPVDVMVDHLKVLAAKEPERVAEVVKQWVQNNARAV